jgi:hypothetical protein
VAFSLRNVLLHQTVGVFFDSFLSSWRSWFQHLGAFWWCLSGKNFRKEEPTSNKWNLTSARLIGSYLVASSVLYSVHTMLIGESFAKFDLLWTHSLGSDGSLALIPGSRTRPSTPLLSQSRIQPLGSMYANSYHTDELNWFPNRCSVIHDGSTCSSHRPRPSCTKLITVGRRSTNMRMHKCSNAMPLRHW